MGLAEGPHAGGLPPQNAFEHWPRVKALFAATFATRTRDEWMAVFGGTDACVAPVLTREEYLAYGHTVARGNLIPRAGSEGA
jgi:alpha-methylacyl-CoA racemase